MFKPKPCHCGSENVVCKKLVSTEHQVQCQDCGMRSGCYGSKSSAIAAWNYRPRESELTIELRAARKVIRDLQGGTHE